jgi:hypothetical protein
MPGYTLLRRPRQRAYCEICAQAVPLFRRSQFWRCAATARNCLRVNLAATGARRVPRRRFPQNDPEGSVSQRAITESGTASGRSGMPEAVSIFLGLVRGGLNARLRPSAPPASAGVSA